MLGQAGFVAVVVPRRAQEFGLVIHRLGGAIKAPDQLGRMGVRALDPDQQHVVGQHPQHRIGGVVGIDHLADRAAGIADEIVVAVNLAGALDEMRGVEQGGDLGLAVLGLAAQIFGKWHPAALGVAGLAKVGGKRREVVEGDVRGDEHRIGQQQLAQQGHPHRLALEIVGDEFAHVTGADAVIDRVVKPGAALAQHGREVGLAQAGHTVEQHPLGPGGAPAFGSGIDHGTKPPVDSALLAPRRGNFTRNVQGRGQAGKRPRNGCGALLPSMARIRS